MTPAATEDLRAQITDLVRRVILECTGRTVVPGPADPLFETGDLDSISVGHLVLALETEFGIRLEVQDIHEATLGSVDAITALVAGRNPNGPRER